jgi:aconitate hydratase
MDYYDRAGLTPYLDKLGFNLVGYGCTTCIGNSGPLPEAISAEVRERGLVVASVLSGNRNFEGRIQQDVRANYLASPPLVVAYALAGWITADVANGPLGHDSAGAPVYLKDIWPSGQELQETMLRCVTAEMFRRTYADVFTGDERWQQLSVPEGSRFAWVDDSTYIRKPTFLDGMTMTPPPPAPIAGARVLALLGDSVTTDHISPAGSIKADSPAGAYLMGKGVKPADFNSYGARRGNHEVMVRGTFANVRLRNQLAPDTEGGWTRRQPGGEQMSIYDAAMQYQAAGVPLLVMAGKEYGSGSSRDWAAKGTQLLGVKAVIAESFERIHRSNLVNMGVLPLQFAPGETAASLGLTGTEAYELRGVAEGLQPRSEVQVVATRADGSTTTCTAIARIDTPEELVAFRHGGILPYVVRQLVSRS